MGCVSVGSAGSALLCTESVQEIIGVVKWREGCHLLKTSGILNWSRGDVGWA